MKRNPFLLAVALCGALLLGGCASLRSVQSDVSTYGDWPAERKPGSFVIDRLPSQQEAGDRQKEVEEMATAALLKAGFRLAAAGETPELLVQVGTRLSRADNAPWDDPLWWRGGWVHWRTGLWAGRPGWGLGWRGPWGGWGPADPPRYEREVALLIRERASAKPLFEAHASNEGMSMGSTEMLRAMFEAALSDFPRVDAKSRRVVIALPAG